MTSYARMWTNQKGEENIMKLKSNQEKVQVNILLPKRWKEAIDERIREESYQKKKNYTFQSYLREFLAKEFGLIEEGEH